MYPETRIVHVSEHQYQLFSLSHYVQPLSDFFMYLSLQVLCILFHPGQSLLVLLYAQFVHMSGKRNQKCLIFLASQNAVFRSYKVVLLLQKTTAISNINISFKGHLSSLYTPLEILPTI